MDWNNAMLWFGFVAGVGALYNTWQLQQRIDDLEERLREHGLPPVRRADHRSRDAA